MSTIHPNQNQLNHFFNQRASGYAANRFVDYLFTEREQLATDGDDLQGLSVLDIGCGTGRLYVHLSRLYGDTFQYLGIDPAEEMLMASTIPKSLRRVGDIAALKSGDGPFNRIYLLGVTTYLPDSVLLPLLARLAERLSTGGKLIVQFTNKHSLEVRLRQWLRPLLQRLVGKAHVASGDFQVYPRSVAEVATISPALVQGKLLQLPASLPGLQYLSPSLAVKLSRGVANWAPGIFRMDFMVVYSKRE